MYSKQQTAARFCYGCFGGDAKAGIEWIMLMVLILWPFNCSAMKKKKQAKLPKCWRICILKPYSAGSQRCLHPLIAVLLSYSVYGWKSELITPHLFKLANTPAKMIKAFYSTDWRYIRPCGFAPRKVKKPFMNCQKSFWKHGGQVPDNMEALEHCWSRP